MTATGPRRRVRPARYAGGPPDLPVFADDAFPSPLRHAWLVTRAGALLATAISVCFLTGLVSHLHQHPVAWLPLPPDPAWGYRLTQGIHVTTGLAAIPLLGLKLWSVYPRLWAWPPVRSAGHALERLSVGLLAAATAFELVTGTLNLAHLYLWSFLFPVAHYAVAWVVVGSVLVHLAVKWPLVVEAWHARAGGGPADDDLAGERASDGSQVLSRRGVLGAALLGSAAVAAVTVGQTLRPLGWAGLLAPRSPQDVPLGVPVNRTAADAGVVPAAQHHGYALTVQGPTPRSFALADLAALPQHEVELPLACVEGWSAVATWGGVRLRDVLDRCGVAADATVRVVSLEADGLYATAEVPPQFARHEDTLLALRLAGAPLTLDHGYPVRLIAPDRPGVLQTKWVSRIEVL